jgi:hypothetical protein
MVRCRPPQGGRGGAGSKGATIAHNSSGTRSSARVVLPRTLPDQPQKERNDVLGPEWIGAYLVLRVTAGGGAA